MDARQLARQVINTLDLQKEYFRLRTQDKLSECKAAEKRLRDAANEILHPERTTPGLFGGEGE